MNLKQIALFSLVSISIALAQNSTRAAPDDPMNSAPTPATSMPGFQVTEEDMMLIKMLLNNEMFKNSFTEQCSAESASFLGATQAAKSCQCAYDGLLKNDQLLFALATTDNDDGFGKWGYDVIAPCLPEKFTDEMGSAFVNRCVAENGASAKAVCDCTYKTIVKKYTVRSLIKAAFETPEKMQLELVSIAGSCALK